MRISSRPDRGLWVETVQLAVSLSYLPDGLAWPGLAWYDTNQVCLPFLGLPAHTPPPGAGTPRRTLPQENVNTQKKKTATLVTEGGSDVMALVT